ncbi:MAG: Transcriptional regulatory protein LiaR [Firmicutes bacterium ADurb.Bin419]|nr:MAG: Transcriptional regulatory protein LiaR [Firmicutes bacterium ADurb.Bin419]
MKKNRLIIVEDDEKWVMAMKLFLELEPDLEIVAIASNYNEAIEIGISKDADVILMDINLSGNDLDGIYATAEILSHKEIKVIMLTSICDREVIQNAYVAGAVNYVMKNNYKEIPSIIRNTILNVTPNEVLAKDYMKLKTKELLSPLTSQEREIFNLFSNGKNKKDIQNSLFISESTLKNHVHNIIHKLNVNSIQQAIDKVKRKGFIKEL